MRHVALYTFGIVRQSASASQWQGFRERALIIYDRAEKASGYVAHARKPDGLKTSFVDVGQDFDTWGTYAIPTKLFGLDALDARQVIATLSVWTDCDCARGFVYSGAHGDALKSRAKWFERGAWPGHVLWPIERATTPVWAEGVHRLELLAAHGDDPAHFTFSSPWSRQR